MVSGMFVRPGTSASALVVELESRWIIERADMAQYV
jgi:hypothetical protein